jgi:hypothetical protein
VTATLVADAKVKNDPAQPTSVNTNYGTTTDLQLRAGAGSNLVTYRAFLKFDVRGLGAGRPLSAILRMTVTDASNDPGHVFAVANTFASSTSPWTETGVTFNNAPTIAGAQINATPTAAGTTIDFPLTVDAFAHGDGVYSFALTSTSTDSVKYASRETWTPPKLILTAG